jgi:hypothetical protein
MTNSKFSLMCRAAVAAAVGGSMSLLAIAPAGAITGSPNAVRGPAWPVWLPNDNSWQLGPSVNLLSPAGYPDSPYGNWTPTGTWAPMPLVNSETVSVAPGVLTGPNNPWLISPAAGAAPDTTQSSPTAGSTPTGTWVPASQPAAATPASGIQTISGVAFGPTDSQVVNGGIGAGTTPTATTPTTAAPSSASTPATTTPPTTAAPAAPTTTSTTAAPAVIDPNPTNEVYGPEALNNPTNFSQTISGVPFGPTDNEVG